MRIWLFLISVLTFTLTATAQTPSGSLNGKITDANGQPLEHVVIQVAPSGQIVTTETDGTFRVANLAPGNYTLSFNLLGFKAQQKEVVLQAGETKTITATLEEGAGTELGEVVITGKGESTILKESGFAVQSIEVERFKNFSADVNQILNNVSGVRIRQTGGLGSDFSFSLNGLSDARVRFFMDDIPLDYLGEAFKLNSLPINFANRIDVFKGVVPIDLGADALGGAVNIVTAKKNVSFADVSYSVGSFNTHRFALNTQYRNKKTGLTIRPKAFYNFSNNNYTMYNMEVYDFENSTYSNYDTKRFHDNYMSASAMVEAGFTFVEWADEFMIGYTASKVEDDIQTDFFGNPIGEAVSEETNNTLTFKFNDAELFANKRLSLKLFAVLNTTNSIDIDTATNRYNWLGKLTRPRLDYAGEIANPKSHFVYEQEMFTYRAYLKYALSENHALSTNYISYGVKRQGENRLGVPEEQPFHYPNQIKKDVLGLAYEGDIIKDKLNVSAAAKYYHFNIDTKNARIERDYSVVIEDQKIDQQKVGFYLVGRYFITPQLFIKTSFERGYRLPEPIEIFGDGMAKYANPFLRPESSNNLNIGANFTRSRNNGMNGFTLQGNVFYRDVTDYMFVKPFRGGSRVENTLSVLVFGVELDAEYKWHDRLRISANVTQQNVLNNEKYNHAGNPVAYYRDQLPNTPYFFSNLAASYDILQRKDLIGLAAYYSINYVHEFYLGYKSVATAGDKNIIPSQLINNVGVTLTSLNKRYSLNLECNNVFNALAFDNYRIQKPGRSVNVKLRFNITKH